VSYNTFCRRTTPSDTDRTNPTCVGRCHTTWNSFVVSDFLPQKDVTLYMSRRDSIKCQQEETIPLNHVPRLINGGCSLFYKYVYTRYPEADLVSRPDKFDPLCRPRRKANA
jgi:hypothetical protein